MELAAPKSSSGWDEAIIVLAAAASMAALSQRLPFQNVLPAALIAALIGGLTHALSSNPNFSLPFGPIVFSRDKIFDTVPWTVPLLWVIAIFNGRGMARLILRPWRKVKNFGFWLIGLTAVLAMVFDVGLEPFAWHVKHFWFWQPTRIAITWQGTSPLNFLGWACVALLIMMFASPLFIRKQPGNPKTPNLYPLIFWLGAWLLFAVGAAAIGQWWTVAVDAALGAVTAVLAVRGMKW
ncbi:MAG: carotenoid biosynthesis protein [Verrucomicrobiota bacterium]|jgi:uncharacterized membrane protein